MNGPQLVVAPGARVEIRDEEWVVRTVKPEASGGQAIEVTGVSELVRSREAIFLDAIDEIVVLRPEDTELVADTSSRYANARLYLESLFRRTPATDATIHLGHRAAITPVDVDWRRDPSGVLDTFDIREVGGTWRRGFGEIKAGHQRVVQLAMRGVSLS